MRVLVVDDSPETVSLIEPALVREGYEVVTAPEGETALELASSFAPDVVVLDLMLPGVDGLEVCRRIRAMGDAYVIMLTSKTDEADRVIGLTVGADDYVTKPFYPRELIARVSAVLRRPRQGSEQSTALVVADIALDRASREVEVGGRSVSLTKIEFDLLGVLMSRPAMVFSKETLREQVWGPNWFGPNHVIDVHIANLRKKIDHGRKPSRITTVRGVGFRLTG